MSRLLSAAERYAAIGWHVLPLHGVVNGGCTCGRAGCKSPGKHPRTIHGLRQATTDPATVQQLWRRWQEANIGVVTGAPSGFIALDIDPRHGGEDSLEDLIREHGPLPSTREQITGGEGRHILFKHPGLHVSNMNGGSGLAPGIDVKGDDGYVVVAPSIHISGRRYAWDGLEDAGIADAPAWLLERLRSAPRSTGGASTDPRKFGEG